MKTILAALAMLGIGATARAADGGEYLTRAADCAACHTAPNGAAYAGGRAFTTPYGVIYSTNITPDRDTGIGAYTDAEWLRLLRQGIAQDGRHVYPAMPYANYTLLSDADALAIKAYLLAQPAIHSATPPARLRFPYNQRWGLALWNIANNPDRRFTADPAKSENYNRGAYLTEALGHCNQCHSPRNWMAGVKSGGAAYGGAVQQGWLAYNITSDPEHGIGGWTDASLVEYLATGQTALHGPASGPMAEVVSNSLRYLTATDIAAMVTYLRAIAPVATGPRGIAAPAAAPAAAPSEDRLGGAIFAAGCSGCHLANGAGRQSPWASLVGAHSAADPAGTNLVQSLLGGSVLHTATGRVFMPSFAGAYTDAELAAVARYTAARFGNVQISLTAPDIARARPEITRTRQSPP